jgi:hypothetical protein
MLIFVTEARTRIKRRKVRPPRLQHLKYFFTLLIYADTPGKPIFASLALEK